MIDGASIPLVTTIQERCRECYMCVRECPAKAIRIASKQAHVLAERCIGCGNCVRVCTQNAKHVYDSTGEVRELLASGAKVAAIVAPSFPAEFTDCTPAEFVGMTRALGFTSVHEVSFGADLVATQYRQLLANNGGKRYIAANCPAIVAFVERYYPDLTDSIAPIVSPMIALARALKQQEGDDLRIVFAGPCIAKKGELRSRHLHHEVDMGLTFREMRKMFEEENITPRNVTGSDFDPPHGGPGGLFPISRGLLQAAHIEENLMDGQVVAADGRSHFVEAIEEFEAGNLGVRLLEILACNGCINGPGIANGNSVFARRNSVGRYVRERMVHFDWERWHVEMAAFEDLDLSRGYAPDDQRVPAPSEEELANILHNMGKSKHEDELNCGACGYDTCREHAIAIYKGLAESEMCLPYTIDQLRKTMQDLAISKDKLHQTREALLQSERLASMGQLAAGIAHELNNPLGVVLMYSHLLQDDYSCEGQMREDLDMITEQADRCKKIVAGLLHFARQNRVDRKSTDLCKLVQRALQSCPCPDGIETHVVHELENPKISLDADQILQVLTNLIGNAYAAMPEGGELTVRMYETQGQVKLSISDTGVGIPKAHRDKIFEPFFTTKEAGQGTGLGLAVSYGIVKMHRGDITVVTNDDPSEGPTGTTFTVSLPK